MHHTRRPGFTLVELLVVIAITAILAALISMALFQSKARARNTRAEAEMTKGGIAIETYKTQNNDQVLIVQQPYYPPNPSQIQLECFAATAGLRCYPTNAIGPLGDNGFTSFLFNGKEDASNISLKFTTSAAPLYTYAYMTQDCSFDSLASSGNVHKISNFTTYMLATSIDPGLDGSSVYDFWIRDGNSGYGTDAQAPILPLNNPQVYTTGLMSTCSYNYP